MNRQIESKGTKITIFLALAAMLAASTALANPGRGGGPEGERGHHGKMGGERGKQMHKRFKAMMSKALRQDVGLDEQTARKVEQVHAAQQDQRRASHQQMFKAKRALRTLVDSDSNDQKAFATAVEGLIQARAAMQKLREEGFAKVRALLTPKQQAKLLLTMHKARRQMHGAMGPHGGKGSGQKRGPDGPPDDDADFEG